MRYLVRTIAHLSIYGLGVCPLLCLAQSSQIDSLNLQAYRLYRENIDASKVLAYKALSLAQKDKLNNQIVDSYINLSRCFRLETKWDSAYEVLEQAIFIGKQFKYTEGLMHATNNFAACYLMQGEWELARPMLKQSLTYAQQSANLKGQANAHNNLAITAEAQLDFEEALFYLDSALLIYQQMDDSSGLAQTYANQAHIFDAQEQNDSAIVFNFRALRIFEELGLTSQQASTHTQIGALYDEQEYKEKALEQYQFALQIYDTIGNVYGLATSYINIGPIYEELYSSSEALPYLEKGLQLAQKTEDPLLIGSALINLAGAYFYLNIQIDKVESMIREAIPYLEEAESNNLPKAYYRLANMYDTRGQLTQAKTWYIKALESAAYFEDLVSQRYTLKKLVDISEEQGNLAPALKYSKRYQLINDSLINLQSLETINQLSIEYESEKKEKENLILQNNLTQAELVNAERTAQRNLILGIGAVILVLSLAAFVWYRSRQRIRMREQQLKLEEERLRKEQQAKEAEKLRELDAMKTRFFTNISHEFRTPLTLILGKNEQMQAAIADPQFQNGFEMVGRNGHRLLDLVNQVLDVAKIEAGGMELKWTRLDAIPFLKHMLYSFESMANEKGIKLGFESNSQAMETAFDHQKIERVIFNLLSNAVKFTPDGGRIGMKVESKQLAVGSKQSFTDPLPTNLLISITDSGVGIKANQLPYIFDRFYQADSSENQPQPGTGIGLSLVKELVELHGGTIEVTSELNQGTTFHIALPIPKDLAQYPSQASEQQLSIAALPSKTLAEEQLATGTAQKREKILLVEDNHDVRAFVKEQIISFGYEVEEAKDGVEGLEKAQESIPDLIISDIMMPRLDGYGVAKGLKEDERTSHIPVVLLTSKASDESRIAGLELGVDDYLLKPFNAKELEIRIANLIEQRKRLRERFSSATIIRPNEVSAVSTDQVFLKKVLEAIESHLADEQFGVERLADHADMSVSQLNRKLSALVDQTAGKLIRSMRLQRAADLIKQQAGNITEIAYDTGFSNHTSFYRNFKKQFGMTPTEYQQQHRGS